MRTASGSRATCAERFGIVRLLTKGETILMLGDEGHVPHNPSIASNTVPITVR